MGNASFNPISALTRALMSEIMNDPALASMVGQVMGEVKAVAEALGAHVAMSVEERLTAHGRLGRYAPRCCKIYWPARRWKSRRSSA